MICALALVSALQMPPRFQELPGYDRYRAVASKVGEATNFPRVEPRWAEDSRSFRYVRDGKAVRVEVPTLKQTPAPAENDGGVGRREFRDRGRQFTRAEGKDGVVAIARDRNVYLKTKDGVETAITTDGDAAKRVKYGTASWVYGEELGVTEAMWFSPDGTKLAFYRFDESPVKDYYLAMDQDAFQSSLDVEAYPKAGTPNPIVSLLVYDLTTKKTVAVDTDFGDAPLGEYVYEVRWAPDGKELLFNRTNRKQNRMQLCAADPVTGAARSIVEESQPQSWAENTPTVVWLKDGDRFVWSSERNGFRNFYLYDRSGKLLRPLTQNRFDASVPEVREETGELFYRASDGDNPYFLQLHRVGLDGTGDRRLTDPKFHHDVRVSPDGRYAVDRAQTPVEPPSTSLIDLKTGTSLGVIVASDLSGFRSAGFRKAIPFDFVAADGKTPLHGLIWTPTNFDAKKKYPVVLDLYGGPESTGLSPMFARPRPETELGFAVVTLAPRGTMGRGKAFRDAVYGKLGGPEIDDAAAGIRAAGIKFPWFDATRVGLHGTSYGGTFTLMSMLRYPDLYKAGAASSAVTDWRHYDTIYTERYMGLPSADDNRRGYDDHSAIKLAGNLKGRLMLYYGTADNNVHPANTLMLINALEREGKRYEMSVGPDRGHTQMPMGNIWATMVDALGGPR